MPPEMKPAAFVRQSGCWVNRHFLQGGHRLLQAIARLQQATSAVTSTLLKVMLDPATPASTKVRAAECIMNGVGATP
jgi:hypothetical protein